MLVIRPITLNDGEALEKFAFTVHLGVTSLPKNKEKLKQKLLRSIESFRASPGKPGKEIYLFILEDLASKQKIGVCGIWAKTGSTEPIYLYQIETIHSTIHDLPIPHEQKLLRATAIENGPTEVGGLYILPEFRHHGGAGRLLSISRFLFMSVFPYRFETTVMANMRGNIDDNDNCLFWNGVGKPFLNYTFPELMERLWKGKEFIPTFMPKHPIYISLLSQEIQANIGNVHARTKPAYEMLRQQGFQPTNQVDLFDGGPIISTQLSQITAIRESHEGIIQSFSTDSVDLHSHVICNNKIEFLACLGHIVETEKNQVQISKAVADTLQVNIGDKIRYTHSGHHDK